jgi:environmental stress-induced protein Ves
MEARERGRSATGRSSVRVVRVEDVVATRWPNGGGWTREIHRQLSAQHPRQPVWRLSMATIDTTGPFSVLPEVRRCLLLASDTSLRLSIDGNVYTLGYTDSVAFDGGAAVEVVDVSGESRVLNLMTYGGVGGHLEVSRPAEDCDMSERDGAAVVVLDGRLHVLEESLGRYDTLVLGRESVAVRCEAATVVRVGLGETQVDLPGRPRLGGAAGPTDCNSEPHAPRIEHRGD